MPKLDREQFGEMLSAYLDGETDQRETEFVERLIREDESARKELEELRNVIDLVGHLPRHPAPPSIAEDLRNRMERDALLGSSETSPVAEGKSGAPRGSRLSIAAMIGLVAIVGVWFLRDRGAADRQVDRLAQVDQAKRPDAFRDDLEMKVSRRKLKQERSRSRASSPLSKNAPAAALRKKRSLKRRAKPVSPRGRLEDRAAVAPAEKDTAPRPNKAVRAEEKRAQAVTATMIRTHAFSHEPLRLRIGVADGARRDEAVHSLVALMTRQRVVPLSTRPQEGAKDSLTNGRFYYQGAPGINYEDAGTAQMLVRVAARDLPKLVDGLTQSTGTEHVSLVAGPLVFDGLKEIRRTLLKASEYGSAQNTDVASKLESQDGRFPERNAGEPAASPSFDGLLEMLGVDPEWLRGTASATTSTKNTGDEQDAPLDSGGLGKKTDRVAGASPSAPPPDVARVKDAEAGNGHPSLVERGLYSVEQSMARHRASRMPAPAVAERSREDRDQPPAMAAEAEGRQEYGPSDRFVTLVVEFFVAKQDPPRVRPARSGAGKRPRVKRQKPSSEQRIQK